MDVRTRPTLEQSSAAADLPDDLPGLPKSLVLTTDDAAEMDRDLEGLVVLSPNELILVIDNDFSVEGARTRFWRVKLAVPLGCRQNVCAQSVTCELMSAPWCITLATPPNRVAAIMKPIKVLHWIPEAL